MCSTRSAPEYSAELSKRPISTKAQVIAELDKMVVDRLFRQQPWLADPKTISAYDRKLIQMGLVEQVHAEPPTWQRTPLGKELDVDLFEVFIGIHDPLEGAYTLADHGLIDESDCEIIRQRLDKGEDEDSVLVPFVKRAYFEYRISANCAWRSAGRG